MSRGGTNPSIGLVRHGLVVALLACLSATGCAACDEVFLGGEEPEPTGNPDDTPKECVAPRSERCGETESFRDGRCQSTYCESDAECCPGTRCDLGLNLCRSRLLLDSECETDADCLLKGQKCQEVGSGKSCVFPPCSSDEQCDPGMSCFKGACVGQNPCPDGCGPGEVCDVATASCHPALDHEGCAVTCEPGTLKTLTDPRVMTGEVCCAWECECAPLPPLSPGIIGLYASVAVAHLEVAVASYDVTYGDLVVSHYDQGGALQDVDYVDGFDPEGTIGGALDGPRGGVVEPGPDVGRFASATVDPAGRIQVAYYDATDGALKHAVQVAKGIWRVGLVDDTADAGQFASMAIRTTDGVPVIAYFVTGVTDPQGRPASGVKLAIGKTADPLVPADWNIRIVELAPDFDACNHSCNSAQAACVLDDGAGGDAGTPGAACKVVSSGCSPSCASGQACVVNGGNPECMALGNAPVEGLPRALGIFTSLALHEDTAMVAYYDNVQGDLKAATLTPAGPAVVVTVDGDGAEGHRGGDVGAYTSVAVDALGKIALVYEDFTRHELRFYHGSTLTSGTYHTVDSGRGQPPGFHLVGAGAQLAFAADGTAYVVYQEQSLLNLRVAQREPDGTWTIVEPPPVREGPHGFYGDIGLSASNAYVVSVMPALDENTNLDNQLGLQVLPIPFP
ncbi:MAG: hypothetical protein AB2A00_42980 [Myxococcota bacterium]